MLMCTWRVIAHMQHMFRVFETSINTNNNIEGGNTCLNNGLGMCEGCMTLGAPVVHQPCAHAWQLACCSCTLMWLHMECVTWCVKWQQHRQRVAT